MDHAGWIAFAVTLNILLWAWKPFFTGYMAQKGKNVATREDIETVLKEVRAVTKETETIKAQIGSDLWLRQTIWNHKREAYTNIAKRCHTLQGSLNALLSTRIVLKKTEGNPAEEQHLMNLRSQIGARAAEYAEAHRQFLDALTEGEIFLDGVTELRGEYLDSGDADAAKAVLDAETADKALTLLSRWATKLVTRAKEDLGAKSSG